MKIKLVAIALVLLTALAANARADDEWKEFKSDSGRFSILLPGTPEEKVTKDVVETHAFDLVKDNESHGVMYTDFPEKSIAIRSPETIDKILEGVSDSISKKNGAKVRSSKKITLNGNPGREIVVDAAGDITVHSRMYFVQNRLYQVFAVAPQGDATDATSIKMLDSFKLIEK